MTPTKEQIEKARESVENFMRHSWSFYRDESQDGLTKVSRTPIFHAAELKESCKTILSCLTPPEPAASEAEVGEAVFIDDMRLMVDISVPDEMILFPDEKTKQWFLQQLEENDVLDKSCHDRGTALQRKPDECAKLEATIHRLKADRKLAVEALKMLLIEAKAVADDCHRPRYTRLDEALLSSQQTLSKLTASKVV
ncbi:MAG: hypothetical protein KGL39_59870 [Patescibacteria group bacterium]|nr:hypothetical protein [Patescibacteria group bacterium]